MNMLGLLPKLKDLNEEELKHISFWIATWQQPQEVFDKNIIKSLRDLAFYDRYELLKMAEHYLSLYGPGGTYSPRLYKRLKYLVEECSGKNS